MILGVDHVTVTMPTGQEPEGCRFYGEILGLKQIPKPTTLAIHGGVWFELPDGRQLHLQSEAAHIAASRAHPAFVCEDLELISATLVTEGYPVYWDEALAPRNRFYSHDPFGNRLEFLDKI